MAISERENYLRNASMNRPEWIPCRVAVSGATWNQLREELEEVLVRHPILFPDFKKGERNYDNWDFGPAHRANEKFTDAWGCIWESSIDGLEGQVIKSPLGNWDKLKDYKVPDSLRQADRAPANWGETAEQIEKAKEEGVLASGDLPHGFFFMRLYYLRGFENLMFDIAMENPRLPEFIPTPPENIDALCEALEEFRTYWQR